MPNMTVAMPNIGGALCPMPQSLADARCKYDLVVYDNLQSQTLNFYIINKHFSKKIEILYSEIPMNTNTTKCSNIYVYNQYMNVQIIQK